MTVNPGRSALPAAVARRGDELLERLEGKPMRLGECELFSGWIIETHTIGCRNHADVPEAQWWDQHHEIYDEYRADGTSVVEGDPSTGIFITFTPRRSVD